MKIKDHVTKEFYSFGYEDAKLGRKLSDADYFILAEAKRFVQSYFGEKNILTDNRSKKIKHTKKILGVGSEVIQMWEKSKNNQKKLDEINEAITILNNEISNIEADINSLNCLMEDEISGEVENIFGTLLYHYERGYLTYEYERAKDPKPLSNEINISTLTQDIIEQYAKNVEYGIDNLD